MKKRFESFESSMFKQTILDFYTQSTLDPPCIQDSQSFEEALGELKSRRSSALCVVDSSGKLVGVVTEKDLLKYRFSEDFNPQEALTSFMTPNPHCLDQGSDFKSVLVFFKRFGVRTLPIVDDSKKPLLLVTTGEALEILTKGLHNELASYGLIASINIMEIQAQEEDFSLSVYEQEQGRRLDSHLFMTPVRRVFSSSSSRLNIDLDVNKAAKKMIEKRLSAAVVVEYETHLKGILTERDFVKKIMTSSDIEIQQMTLKDVMTPSPRCVLPRHNIAQALNTMFSVGCRQLVVVDEDQMPVGILHLLDILSFFAQTFQKFESEL